MWGLGWDVCTTGSVVEGAARGRGLEGHGLYPISSTSAEAAASASTTEVTASAASPSPTAAAPSTFAPPSVFAASASAAGSSNSPTAITSISPSEASTPARRLPACHHFPHPACLHATPMVCADPSSSLSSYASFFLCHQNQLRNTYPCRWSTFTVVHPHSLQGLDKAQNIVGEGQWAGVSDPAQGGQVQSLTGYQP